MLTLIVPPVAKPCEPLLGAYSLARLARQQRLPCTVIDANLGWFHHQLWGPGRPAVADDSMGTLKAKGLARHLWRAMRHTAHGNPLREPLTYVNRGRYQQAVEHLEAVLRASPVNAWERPGLADFRIDGGRAVSRGDLIGYMNQSNTGFDDYLKTILVPRLAAIQPDVIGISVTFLHQIFATVRMAKIIREALPGIPLVLGGALVECWRSADWKLPPFDRFDAVISLAESSWKIWREHFAMPLPHPYGQAFFPDPADILRQPFFSSEPIFPMALGLGCAWGRCTFCPDYQQHPYQPAQDPSWLETVELILGEHPSLVIHLTDSCVPPTALDQLASIIQQRGWPVRWYAFVRLEKSLLQPGRLEGWARGGCAMLQFGLETAAPELLKLMHKGIHLNHAASILQRAAALGIRNYVYLLFGFPGETADHLQQTMDFVICHQNAIHYLNNALFNLPKWSPMATHPGAFAITKLRPFPGEDGHLSIYLDFEDNQGSSRKRARAFLQRTFLADAAIRQRVLALPPVFKSNHAPLAQWP